MATVDFDKAIKQARAKWNQINADSIATNDADENAIMHYEAVFVVWSERDDGRYQYSIVPTFEALWFGYDVGDFRECDVVACIEGPDDDDWTEY